MRCCKVYLGTEKSLVEETGEKFIGSLLDLSVEGWSMSSSFCTWEDDCPILWLQLGSHSDGGIIVWSRVQSLLSRFCRGEGVARRTRQLVKN